MTEMTELEELECIYCEMHKDVYGVKARWYKAASVEQARADLDRLEESLKIEMAHQAEMQQQAIVRFEARLQALVECGAKSRADAIRWLHEGSDTGGDDEYLCYTMGLPYGYLKKVA